MGSKRSYDGEEPFQLPFKFSKQFSSDEKLNSFADEKLAPVASILPRNECQEKLVFPVEYPEIKVPRGIEPLEVQASHGVRTVADKGAADGVRFSWFADSHGDDYGWLGGAYKPLSPQYFEHGFPGRAAVHVEDTLSSFLDLYPRKQVPVGPDYQADLPEWEPTKMGIDSDKVMLSIDEEKYMGTCVIPMPDSCAENSLCAGAGRRDCICSDWGSVRCVRQHVKEAREKLLKAFGEDTFRELGFLEMGEDVIAHKWSEEEEHVFHELVFSNPASLGRDFWLCLSDEFPTKSQSEIVSYYFNVFMLRKRAAQNRSRFLDIDSDDDEWHPGHGRNYKTGYGDEDEDSMLVQDEDSSGEDDGSDDDDDNSDGDEGSGSQDADAEVPTKSNMGFLHKDGDFIPGNQDDSCLSFEYQSGISDSTPTKGGSATKELNGVKNSKYFPADINESGHDLSHHGDFDDSSNFRQWNQGFSSGLDNLLPTWNIIEEIFGPGSWGNKPTDD